MSIRQSKQWSILPSHGCKPTVFGAISVNCPLRPRLEECRVVSFLRHRPSNRATYTLTNDPLPLHLCLGYVEALWAVPSRTYSAGLMSTQGMKKKFHNLYNRLLRSEWVSPTRCLASKRYKKRGRERTTWRLGSFCFRVFVCGVEEKVCCFTRRRLLSVWGKLLSIRKPLLSKAFSFFQCEIVSKD